MDLTPVRVPEERTWGGLASRTVVRMARSPWASLGWVSLALVAVLLPSRLVSYWDAPHLPLIVGLPTRAAGFGAYVGALLLLTALPARFARTYHQAIALCGVVVVLPSLAATCWVVGELDVIVVPLAMVFGWIAPPLAAASVLLVGFHWLACNRRPPQFRVRDWLVLVALWVPAVVLVAWMDNSVEWFAALRSLVLVLVAPILTHASRRTLWLIVPLGVALASALAAVCEVLPYDTGEQWRQYQGDMSIWLYLPCWPAFLLGAAPFAFLARRATRMSVLPPRE